MYVWIPRFAYNISSNLLNNTTDDNSSQTAGTINIEFLVDDTNVGYNGTTYSSPTVGSTTVTTSSWQVHPGFNLGTGNATEGFWIMKFEPSDAGDESIGELASKPGVTSLRGVSIGNFYTYMLLIDTFYGLTGSTSTTTAMDSHMIKNDEWGAVAYLTQSAYGINTKVYNDNTNSNYYTGGGTTTSYQTNTSQSTTGNIYGVYDMAGLAWEYVAAYVANGASNLTNYGSSFASTSTSTSYMDSKYVNIYPMGSPESQANNYTAWKQIYGDAVSETSSYYASSYASWHGEYADTPFSTGPFFLRGGIYGNSIYAGVFAFNNNNGNANSNNSSRAVLVGRDFGV